MLLRCSSIPCNQLRCLPNNYWTVYVPYFGWQLTVACRTYFTCLHLTRLHMAHTVHELFRTQPELFTGFLNYILVTGPQLCFWITSSARSLQLNLCAAYSVKTRIRKMPGSEKIKFKLEPLGFKAWLFFCEIITRPVSNVMQRKSAWGQLGVSKKSNNCQKMAKFHCWRLRIVYYEDGSSLITSMTFYRTSII
jgi:hypothetical protein